MNIIIGLGNYTLHPEFNCAVDIDEIQLLPSVSLDKIGSGAMKQKKIAIDDQQEDRSGHAEEASDGIDNSQLQEESKVSLMHDHDQTSQVERAK